MHIIYSVLLIFSLTLAVKSENQLDPLPTNEVDGFKKIGDKFYYIDDNSYVMWYTALEICQGKGGHLASLQNEKEFELLKANLNNNNRYWIDLNDIRNEGKFESETTGEKATYLRWHPSYNPDNKWDLENCVCLWYKYNQFGMNDAKCTLLKTFICEKEFTPIQKSRYE